MSHSYNKIWLHVVFANKFRTPLIHASIQNKLYGYMRQQLIGNKAFKIYARLCCLGLLADEQYSVLANCESFLSE